MNARRRSRRRRRRILPARARLGAVAAALLFAATIAGVQWLRSPPGRMAMADRGVAAAQQWATRHLAEAILARLDGMGVPADSVRVQPGGEGEPVLLRFSAPGSLLETNLALTSAVEDAGGTVHRGRRHATDQGEWIELLVGTRSGLTHRIVAHRGAVAPSPPPLPEARLALVIDDIGHNLNAMTRRAFALDAPITFSILPDLRYSQRALTEIQRAGKPAFLHMPMETEPGSDYDAGEPQVRVGMTATEIESMVARCLDGLPGVLGLNNHMGSLATRSRPEMDAVMEVLAERGLVFLDSQTTPHSVAHLAAAARGVPCLRNDLFVDADTTEDPRLVVERLRQLVAKAERRGWAIGIGHVNEATVSALEQFLPRLDRQKVELVSLTDLIREHSQ